MHFITPVQFVLKKLIHLIACTCHFEFCSEFSENEFHGTSAEVKMLIWQFKNEPDYNAKDYNTVV